MKTLYLLDDDKNKTFAGDTVRFNYGIPPVKVDAQIIERNNKLIALTPGHTPDECNLRSLRRYVGNWYKVNLNIETRIEKAKTLGWKKICSRRFPEQYHHPIMVRLFYTLASNRKQIFGKKFHNLI